VDLVLPRRWLGSPPTARSLAGYYQVEPSFNVVALASLYPSQRGVEKAAHSVAASLSRIVRGADVVYTRNIPVLMSALSLSSRPVVYETYRPWPRQHASMGRLFGRIGRHPRFLGAVLHSELALRSYASCGIEDSRLLVAHNGYDPKRVLPAVDVGEARSRCGLAPERTTVVYSGRVNEKKGLGLVLDMAEACPDLMFVIVGSEKRGAVERRAEAMDNVKVVGWLPFDEVVDWLYAADVLLIPPTRGPLERVGNTVLPLKTFLYMAVGRPVFGPATPDLREVLEDGETAVLVPPDDPGAAVDALRGLTADPDRMRRIGEAAREASEDRTWSRRADRIIGFVRSRLELLPRDAPRP
jgi:glycosyltransferase involved in cell wall biosynthesis